MREEDRIRAFLYPEEVEVKKDILSPEEDEKEAIEAIEKDLKIKLAFEKEISNEKDYMHEEYQERYNPEMRITVILNTIIIFILLMLGWFIVVIEFQGNVLTWLICPLLTIAIVYDRFNPFTMKVPPNKAARKAVKSAVAASMIVALGYEGIKHLLRYIRV